MEPTGTHTAGGGGDDDDDDAGPPDITGHEGLPQIDKGSLSRLQLLLRFSQFCTHAFLCLSLSAFTVKGESVLHEWASDTSRQCRSRLGALGSLSGAHRGLFILQTGAASVSPVSGNRLPGRLHAPHSRLWLRVRWVFPDHEQRNVTCDQHVIDPLRV